MYMCVVSELGGTNVPVDLRLMSSCMLNSYTSYLTGGIYSCAYDYEVRSWYVCTRFNNANINWTCVMGSTEFEAANFICGSIVCIPFMGNS